MLSIFINVKKYWFWTKIESQFSIWCDETYHHINKIETCDHCMRLKSTYSSSTRYKEPCIIKYKQHTVDTLVCQTNNSACSNHEGLRASCDFLNWMNSECIFRNNIWLCVNWVCIFNIYPSAGEILLLKQISNTSRMKRNYCKYWYCSKWSFGCREMECCQAKLWYKNSVIWQDNLNQPHQR